MNPAKNRERKCSTCKHYQPSPLWRKGWCRNPLLYDPQTNHLVEADRLSCSRTFIDYWEPREGPRKGEAPSATDARNPRVAPSIPMQPTGPGGSPLRGSGGSALPLQREGSQRAPQLSLVRPQTGSAQPAATQSLAVPDT